MKKILVVLTIMALCAPVWGVTGKVVDNNGKPVVRAKVAVWTFWTTERIFHTDEKGEFIYLKNVLSDFTHLVTYKITDADGKPVSKAAVTIPWYTDAPTLVFTDGKGIFDYPLPPDSTGVTRVLDSAGRPIPNAKVVATSLRPDWTDEYVMDEKGEYRHEHIQLPLQAKREMGLDVAAKGYTYGSTYYHEGQTEPLVIRVWPEQIVKVKVVGEDGAPLQGATVVLDNVAAKISDTEDFNFSPQLEFPVKIKTGKDGSLLLPHLPGPEIAKSADIALTIDGPGRAKIERRYYKLADLRKSGKIVLPRSCTLQGTLRLPKGIGTVPDDSLLIMKMLEDSYPSSPSEYSTALDKNGKFRFDKLPPGKATIVFWKAGKRNLGWTLPAVQNLRIAPGEVKNLELTGMTGAVISGTVRDKATGNPVPSALLTVEHAGNPEGESYSTDEEGKYWTRVAAGKIKVYVNGVFVKDGRLNYNQKDRPFVSIEITDGQDNSSVDLSINLPTEHEKDPLLDN